MDNINLQVKFQCLLPVIIGNNSCLKLLSFFTTRIVNLWNSLPNNVVEVDTVIHFEKRLDKFWQNVEFKFDYRASPPDRLQPAGTVSQPGSGHRGLQDLRPEGIFK